MHRDEVAFMKAERAKTLVEDRQLAGATYPNCICFNSPVGVDRYHDAAAQLASNLVGVVTGDLNVCPPAIPYFMAQVLSVALAQIGTYACGGMEGEGATDEQILSASEDTIHLYATRMAELLPKLTKAHAATVRRQTSMLGEMAVAAVRADAP